MKQRTIDAHHHRAAKAMDAAQRDRPDTVEFRANDDYPPCPGTPLSCAPIVMGLKAGNKSAAKGPKRGSL